MKNARCATAARLQALVVVLVLSCAAQADVSQGDSADFTLDTTGIAPGTGGVAPADSADFMLDTTGIAPGTGGVASADSADFTLNTTDEHLPTIADSADFTLDTRNPAAVDIGLRVRDGAAALRIGCEPAGPLTSPLRIQKNGKPYGIILVDPDSPEASHIRIQTHSRIKAWMKLP